MGWVVLAFAFAAVWVYAFYREDIRNPEPLWLVGLAMVGGALALVLASWLEARVTPDLSALDGPLMGRARLAFLVAGPLEESAKFLAVALIVWFNSNFDEPMDGIVYAATAAAGFALAENILFIRDEPHSILARGPAGTAVHILFAGFRGVALGHAKQIGTKAHKVAIVCIGLALAFLSHGLFDLITWAAGKEITINQARALQVALVIGCAVFLHWRVKVALRGAPTQHAAPAGAEEVEPALVE